MIFVILATVTWIEALWLTTTGVGLLLALAVFHVSMVNRLALVYAGIDSVRIYLATTEVIRNALRGLTQAIFVGVGVWAAWQPNPSSPVTWAQVILGGAFIGAAALLALASLVDVVRFHHALEYFEETMENGEAHPLP